MIQPPPRATLNDTLFPCSTLFRSKIRADAPQLDLVACAGAQSRAGLQRQLLEVAVDQPVRENVAFDERQEVDEAEIEREPLGRHVGRQIFGPGQRDRRGETAVGPGRAFEIGRGKERERVSQYVWIKVVA